MDEEKIKALLEVAGASSNTNAIDGVLEVQKLMSEYSTLTSTLENERKEREANEIKYKEEIDRSTRTMAKLIADIGLGKPDEPQDTKPEDGYAKFRAMRSGL